MSVARAEEALARVEGRLSASRLGKSMTREADADLLAMRGAAEAIRALIAEYPRITDPKPGVRWEYGVEREQATPSTSREAAEREIKRQRAMPRGYRITTQRLVRRLVSEWEEVTE